MRVVLQAGLKPDPRFPGVPFALDLAKTEEQRQALRFLFSSLAFGRPFVLPPGAPADRVAILRKAFSDMFADRDFLADAARQGYDSVWFGDSQLIWRELYVLMGAFAAMAPGVALGTGVTNPATRVASSALSTAATPL